MVAVDQPLSRHLGTECLPSRLPAMRQLRDPRVVPAAWCDGRRAIMTRLRAAVLLTLLVASTLARPTPAAGQDAGPVIVVETSAGAFAFETFPDEAPKT